MGSPGPRAQGGGPWDPWGGRAGSRGVPGDPEWGPKPAFGGLIDLVYIYTYI